MTRMNHTVVTVFSAIMFLALLMPPLGLAQSSTRGPPQTPARQQGSHAKNQPSTPVGLQGYCPVCILDMKKWVKGDPGYQSTFDGHVYFFPGPEQKQKFDANPTKYVPALGGDCVVAFKKMGKRVAGSLQHAAMQGGRLFLFSSEQAKQEFMKQPQQYVDADLALGGKCAVCRVEMGKDMPGKPEWEVIYHGLRYRFPTQDQLKMFLANPAKYESQSTTASGSSTHGSGSGNR